MIGHRAQVASIAEQLGSMQEAVWIIDHAGPDLAQQLADRRQAGEPLQYLLGSWPFRNLELQVDRRVLIPRPETEQVVQVALDQLGQISRDSTAHRIVVDLGTGTGAIALSLASEGAVVCPDLEVWATDSSPDALAVARVNLESLALTDPAAAQRVELVRGSWFDALPSELAGRVDLLVSNPPYVGESEYADLDPTVREWEPREALVAGPGTGGAEGMGAIETILIGASRWLAPGAAMVIEVSSLLADECLDAARRAGFTQITMEQDLAGRPRTLVVSG
jgi:release factor glutamine methyltransferase